MAAFQAYNKILVCDDDIRNIQAGNSVIGFEFKAQYPSYRGTYLSCIELFEIEIDGETVPEKSIYFQLNGKQFLLSQMKELYAEYWFIMDKAVLRVMQAGGISADTHNITLKIQHRIPYTGYFGQYMVLGGVCTKTLRAI
jgi:Domain of unknown function (DUF6379)